MGDKNPSGGDYRLTIKDASSETWHYSDHGWAYCVEICSRINDKEETIYYWAVDYYKDTDADTDPKTVKRGHCDELERAQGLSFEAMSKHHTVRVTRMRARVAKLNKTRKRLGLADL